MLESFATIQDLRWRRILAATAASFSCGGRFGRQYLLDCLSQQHILRPCVHLVLTGLTMRAKTSRACIENALQLDPRPKRHTTPWSVAAAAQWPVLYDPSVLVVSFEGQARRRLRCDAAQKIVLRDNNDDPHIDAAAALFVAKSLRRQQLAPAPGPSCTTRHGERENGEQKMRCHRRTSTHGNDSQYFGICPEPGGSPQAAEDGLTTTLVNIIINVVLDVRSSCHLWAY